MTVAAPFLKVNSTATTGPPLPAVVTGSPVLAAGVGAPPSSIAPSGLTNFLRGINLNNQVAQYNQGDFSYNITTGTAYGLFGCTATGNALNAGPVWKKFTEDERDYINLAKWGVNYVALGIDWHWWGGSDPTTAQAIAAFAVIDQHVAWAKKYGMWLSLRLFVPPGGTQTYNGNGSQVWGGLASWSSAADNTTFMTQIKDFWKMVARRYTNEPTIFAYDLLNEPSTGNIFTVWYPYANYLCDQINTVDPNHVKMVQTGGDSQTYHPALNARTDMIWSMHMYGPLALTTPGANGPFYSYPGPCTDYDSTPVTYLGVATSNVGTPAQLTVGNTALGASGYPQAGNFTIALGTEIWNVNVASGTLLNVVARNVNALGQVASSIGTPAPIATYITADPGAGGTSIAVAAVANFPSAGGARYITVGTENVTYPATDATHFGTGGSPAVRAVDGTTAAGHAIGSVVLNQKYWNKTTLDQVFRVQGRANIAVNRPNDIGEYGCVNVSPGYSSWVADMAALSAGAWVCNYAHFLDRSPNTTQNAFGLYNANAGGGYLSLTAVLTSEMTSQQVLDATEQTALVAAWPGNPVGRTV